MGPGTLVRAFYRSFGSEGLTGFISAIWAPRTITIMVIYYLDSLDALNVQGQPQVQVKINSLEVVLFIIRVSMPMNEICERAGMSECQIFERTKAVFGFINPPYYVSRSQS